MTRPRYSQLPYFSLRLWLKHQILTVGHRIQPHGFNCHVEHKYALQVIKQNRKKILVLILLNLISVERVTLSWYLIVVMITFNPISHS